MTCPACKTLGEAKTVARVTSAWAKSYPVVCCSGCGLYYLSEKPSHQEVADHYKHSYYRFSTLSLAIKVMFRRFRSASQQAYISSKLPMSGLSVLEVGCGEGSFLHFCKERGATVKGIEYSQEMRAYGAKHYQVDMLDDDFFDHHGSYDLIAMSHVIEHFTDIDAAMVQAKKLLKPGGYLFLEVPNSPRPGEVPEDVLKTYLNTVHIYNFTAESLTSLVEQYGFKTMDIGRFMPNLHRHTSAEFRYIINEGLLYGRPTKASTWIFLAHYLARSLLNNQLGFCRADHPTPWTYNDSLRILAKL